MIIYFRKSSNEIRIELISENAASEIVYFVSVIDNNYFSLCISWKS